MELVELAELVMVLTLALALVMAIMRRLRPQQQQFQTIQAQYWYSVVTLPTAQLTR